MCTLLGLFDCQRWNCILRGVGTRCFDLGLLLISKCSGQRGRNSAFVRFRSRLRLKQFKEPLLPLRGGVLGLRGQLPWSDLRHRRLRDRGGRSQHFRVMRHRAIEGQPRPWRCWSGNMASGGSMRSLWGRRFRRKRLGRYASCGNRLRGFSRRRRGRSRNRRCLCSR